MASTQVNEISYNITRGKPQVLGSLTATTQVIQFALPTLQGGVAGGLDALNLSVVGGTGTTGLLLECSIDGGTSWFGINPRTVITAAGSTAANLFSTTTINSDPAVVAAYSYDVSGLQGATFRVGATGISAGTAKVAGCYA